MKWKCPTAAPIPGAAPAALPWQGPAPPMEVPATPSGNLVARPAGVLQMTDDPKMAALAEDEAASTGRIAGGTVASPGMRARSVSPRLAGFGSARPVIEA